MKTLDEILTMCGDKWLLLSQKDKHGQMVHKVDVATLQRCEGGSGPTFASGSSVAMFDSDIIDLVQKRKTAFEIAELDRGKHIEPPWPAVLKPL